VLAHGCAFGPDAVPARFLVDHRPERSHLRILRSHTLPAASPVRFALTLMLPFAILLIAGLSMSNWSAHHDPAEIERNSRVMATRHLHPRNRSETQQLLTVLGALGLSTFVGARLLRLFGTYTLALTPFELIVEMQSLGRRHKHVPRSAA